MKSPAGLITLLPFFLLSFSITAIGQQARNQTVVPPVIRLSIGVVDSVGQTGIRFFKSGSG
ncbi:MAG TPA: hypothetical protein VKD91_21120 [Pyrinomonadaceae bacterium]|nr:hypothetical protein [Pyrinomonadaceae bacterium]